MRPFSDVVLLGTVLTFSSCNLGLLNSTPESGSRPPYETPLGPAITGLTPGQWQWIDVDGTTCGDGSQTGIGVNPGSGPDLVLFLDGGGACASATTCFGFDGVAATVESLGPFGQNEFNTRLQSIPGSILDRTVPGNPFANATFVFVPYCTGDVHAGNRIVTYTDGLGGTVHQTGHNNVLADMARVASTFASPSNVVISGSSAGGFGALVNYGNLRAYYPDSQGGFLIDDSGPPLALDVANGSAGALIQAGFQNWGITDILDPLCGKGVCEADMSEALKALFADYPGDRFSLLSWSDDAVIGAFYLTTDFGADLMHLTNDVIDPASNARAYVVTGADHTMLGSVTSVTQSGVSLLAFLGEQVDDSVAWSTVNPLAVVASGNAQVGPRAR